MKLAGAVALALMLAGCASTSFQSTWKNPEAAPVLKEKGATVVAVVMAEDKYIRQGAEDALAKELTQRGYKGVASYLILTPEATMDEKLAKAAFEKIGAKAVVTMRPLAADKEVSASSVTVYAGYGGYWGGYHGYGWGAPYGYGGTTYSIDTVLIVETLFYDLVQNVLVWSGRSKTTNPNDVAKFVRELAEMAGWEMNKAGVFKK
jgi:hypothetical protein